MNARAACLTAEFAFQCGKRSAGSSNAAKMHGVRFCGLCSGFPCEWIVGKLGEWDSGGIERQKKPAEEYKSKLATSG